MDEEGPSVSGDQLLQAKGQALISHLKTLAEELTHIEQTDDHGFLQSCAEALGDNKLLRHRDSDVKLLTACCLSDVLRIYAPNTPFAQERLKVVFELFVSQLRGIVDANGPSFARYFYLLERLAMVKSFVLMIDLKCDDLVRQLFEVIFESTSVSHSIRVENHMIDILVTTLEELDVIPQPLLDAILENLVQPSKVEKRAAYALARSILQRCIAELQKPLHQFLQGCLPSSSSTIIESDLRDEWPVLIVELTTISKDYVSYLLPQLTEVIAMEDEQTRLKGVSLLAQLFTESFSVALEFPPLLPAFVAKFTDISVPVRLAMIGHGVHLIQKQSAIAEQLLAALKDRIMDPEEKVRAAVVKSVCDACADEISVFGSLLYDIGHRIRDKRPTARTTARTSLCTLFCRHLTAELSASVNAASAPYGLEWLPQKLLQCYGAESGDLESRLELETLLQTKLLPTDESMRLRAICIMHRDLDQRQRKALLSLLRVKRNTQQQMARWIQLQRALKEKGSDAAVAKAEQARLVKAMCEMQPDAVRAKEVWDQIGASKDQRVIKDLMLLSSQSTPYAELCTVREDFRRRMSQRLQPPYMPLVSAIAARPAMLFLCSAGAVTVLQKVAESLQQPSAVDIEGELKLLVDMTQAFPELLSNAGGKLAEALQAAHTAGDGYARAAQQLLQVVHAVSPSLAHESPGVRKQIVSMLCQKCCSKDAALGRTAAQCLTTQLLVPSLRARTFEMLLIKLRPALTGRAGKQQHCALSVLAALAKRMPSALGPEKEELLREVKGTVTQSAASGAIQEPQLKARCESQCLALKVLANEMIGSSSADESISDGAVAVLDGPLIEHEDRTVARAKDLVNLCAKLIEVNGELGAAAVATSEDRAQLRFAAACALMKMARIPSLKVDALLGPRRWHRIGSCLQDSESIEVRALMAKKLYTELMRPFLANKRDLKLGAPTAFVQARKLGLPPHYCIFFALSAVDPEKAHIHNARNLLTACVKRWHQAAEQFKEPRLMPESQLPWLVHLFAHHPNFGEEDESDPLLTNTQKYLDFYIAVVLGQAAQFDLLRTAVNMIKRALDRSSEDGREVHVVADVAREIIAFRGRSSKYSQKVVPSIDLPPSLFYRQREKPPCQDVDMLPHGFKLLDCIGKTSNASLGGILVKRASPGRKQNSTPRRLKHKCVPSPVRMGKGKARRGVGVLIDEDDDSEEEEEEENEDEDENEEEDDEGDGEGEDKDGSDAGGEGGSAGEEESEVEEAAPRSRKGAAKQRLLIQQKNKGKGGSSSQSSGGTNKRRKVSNPSENLNPHEERRSTRHTLRT
eukprot:CAMPEP_0119320840 /NCGR_PEP_ID=MMETSP1333-20130426/53618_1 /TAXON_ID=418940 /ORGANISM="Scyphosphaera apsteinii, Strain RCC1455" /LENGTH=1313 /DNA_ID=CAMNT_0007327653 /DNA_START=37 /DNA_END=3978 /DNA_ORIENTATION=+